MLRTCRVISIILFYQIFYQLFFLFSSPPFLPPPHFFFARYGYKYGREKISAIGDFIKMNFRPIPDYIERRASSRARPEAQQAFSRAFCSCKNKNRGWKKKEYIKNYRRRREKHHRDIYTITRDPQHFSDPLNPKLHFFPFSFFFPPPLHTFSIPLDRSIDRGIQFTDARDHIAFIELEKFSVSSRCSFRSLGQNISIPPQTEDCLANWRSAGWIVINNVLQLEAAVNGDTATSWQDGYIATVVLTSLPIPMCCVFCRVLSNTPRWLIATYWRLFSLIRYIEIVRKRNLTELERVITCLGSVFDEATKFLLRKKKKEPLHFYPLSFSSLHLPRMWKNQRNFLWTKRSLKQFKDA